MWSMRTLSNVDSMRTNWSYICSPSAVMFARTVPAPAARIGTRVLCGCSVCCWVSHSPAFAGVPPLALPTCGGAEVMLDR